MTTLARWRAIVTYRSETGRLDTTHEFHELRDLHDLIEHGPHWDTIIAIVVTRAGAIQADLTVEAALKL